MSFGSTIFPSISLRNFDMFQEFFSLDGTDMRDFDIACSVEHGMDMEGRVRRFSGGEAEFLDKVFLEVVGEIGLGAEEGDAAG